MNIKKGLMIKDLLQLKNYKKSIVISIVLYIFIAISQANYSGISSMLVIMLTLGFGMYSMATFNYDELAKADKFILTLPVTRKDIVISKYLFAISSTILGGIISVILSFITEFIFISRMPNILDIVLLGIGAIFGIGLIESIQIPCIYKWGSEKGRLHMFIFVIFASVLLGGISYISFDLTEFSNIVNKIERILPIALIGVIVLMYVISYKVSYKIYSRKEL